VEQWVERRGFSSWCTREEEDWNKIESNDLVGVEFEVGLVAVVEISSWALGVVVVVAGAGRGINTFWSQGTMGGPVAMANIS